MFEKNEFKLITYHDSWINVDLIHGCPYGCSYCLLKDGKNFLRKPIQIINPKKCVKSILKHKFFVKGFTPLNLGTDTDIFHKSNIKYLLTFLNEYAKYELENPIILITKSPLNEKTLKEISKIETIKIVFFLSYSGLDKKYEPGIDHDALRENFKMIKSFNFPLIHFWRPLISGINTGIESIQNMLSFVTNYADASVFIGLKLTPILNKLIYNDGIIKIPLNLLNTNGEWIDTEVIDNIYSEGKNNYSDYPLYRHTSCALSQVLKKPNYTATIYRKDICLPSNCPINQRDRCINSQRKPSDEKIKFLLNKLDKKKTMNYELSNKELYLKGSLSQEEYCFILHQLNYPIKIDSLINRHMFLGDIYRENY